MTKVCSKCGKEKDLEAFYNCKRSKDGKDSYCKDCRYLLKQTPQAKLYAYEYNRRPEVREAATRRLHDDPDFIQREKERKEKRATALERRKSWSQSPERKKIEKERKSTPEYKAYMRKYWKDHPEQILVYRAAERAKKFGVPITITEKDVRIPALCPILGIRLDPGNKWDCSTSPSLDRIIPEKGYVPGNVAVISHRANQLKGDGPAEMHRKIASWIVQQLSAPVTPEGKVASSRKERRLINAARSRAKRKGLPFNLEMGDVIIPPLCPILGIPLAFAEGQADNNSPALDKLVPELGYIKGNVAVISYLANRVKSDGTAEEHLKIADWMDSMVQSRKLESTHEEEETE